MCLPCLYRFWEVRGNRKEELHFSGPLLTHAHMYPADLYSHDVLWELQLVLRIRSKMWK